MKPKLYLVLSALLAIIPLLLFFILHQINHRKVAYDFKRNILQHTKEMKGFDLKYNSYYIAGHVGDNLYLGNVTTKPRLLKIDGELRDTQLFDIKIYNKSAEIKGVYQVAVDAERFYLYNGVERAILSGETSRWMANPNPIPKPFFQEMVPLNKQSVVFRYLSSRTNANSLRKETLHQGRVENDQILEKQVDGQFCTTGILNYHPDLNILTYLYAYRNEILVIDTNLKLIRKLKTIDPIDTARFNIAAIQSEDSKVITGPSVLVNAKCAAWKNYLFVQSKIMGRNEDERLFKKSTVIDIYDLQKFEYIGSLYLPNQVAGNIRQFEVVGNHIYTMIGHYIQRYTYHIPNKQLAAR